MNLPPAAALHSAAPTSPAAALQSAAPTYSPFADWLAKFHTASEPIQALWIVALAAVVLGACWCLAAPLRLRLAGRGEPAALRGELIYGIYREPDGRLFLYRDGRALALEEADAARLDERRLRLRG
jgi:hypothetical protein